MERSKTCQHILGCAFRKISCGLAAKSWLGIGAGDANELATANPCTRCSGSRQSKRVKRRIGTQLAPRQNNRAHHAKAHSAQP